jgi:hypothetical protein
MVPPWRTAAQARLLLLLLLLLLMRARVLVRVLLALRRSSARRSATRPRASAPLPALRDALSWKWARVLPCCTGGLQPCVYDPAW